MRVQIASDLAGKPLDQLRVLDLACLEGHYGIELAPHGAEKITYSSIISLFTRTMCVTLIPISLPIPLQIDGMPDSPDQ